MAIRMKEWGMLAAPGQPVHVRTNGLHDWERAAHALGKGVGSVLEGGVELLGLAKVSRTGEMAAFSERLRDISREAREELQETDVRDWDYSWNAAVSPRIAEAVQGLSAESREGGMELARAYSAQASIEAKRDRELRRLETARCQWQQRVDEAVSSGQEEQAVRWLEAGRGVFVPEEQMKRRGVELRSRACLSRWVSRLESAPLQGLAELADASRHKGLLPARQEEQEGLRRRSDHARLGIRRELAQAFCASVQAGAEPDAATVELATRAGVIPAVEARAEGVTAPPSASHRSAWRRWMDTREEGEPGELDARLAVATAPLPLEERRALLGRLERSAQVAAADRRALSNELFSLYSAGVWGCPGDAEAQTSLLNLQDEGIALLAEQGASAVADWLQQQRDGAERWVCFREKEEVQGAAL